MELTTNSSSSGDGMPIWIPMPKMSRRPSQGHLRIRSLFLLLRRRLGQSLHHMVQRKERSIYRDWNEVKRVVEEQRGESESPHFLPFCSPIICDSCRLHHHTFTLGSNTPNPRLCRSRSGWSKLDPGAVPGNWQEEPRLPSCVPFERVLGI